MPKTALTGRPHLQWMVIWGVVILCTSCGVHVVTVRPPATPGQSTEITVSRSSDRRPPQEIPPSRPPAPTRSPEPSPQDAGMSTLSSVVLARAESQMNAGQLDEAIALLESAPQGRLTAKPSLLLREAYNRRALMRYGADRIEDAIADMTRSLEIDPSQTELRAQLDRARERLDRIKALR